MISFSLKFAFKEPLEKSFIYPDFHNANYASINQELVKVNWDSLFNSGLDLQSMYNEFILLQVNLSRAKIRIASDNFGRLEL